MTDTISFRGLSCRIMGDGQGNNNNTNKNKAVRDRSTGQYLVLMSCDEHFYYFTTHDLHFCLISVHVKWSVASWYLCTLMCRTVFGWPVHHTAIPRSEAQDWCSYGFVSEGPAHSDCYTSTTRSMWTSLRSLWTNTHGHNHICAGFIPLISFHTHIIISAQINISCLFAFLFGKQPWYVHGNITLQNKLIILR